METDEKAVEKTLKLIRLKRKGIKTDVQKQGVIERVKQLLNIKINKDEK